jgi:hypothetical protein
MLPNHSDIYVSHADWSGYYTMLKVLKRYIMPLKRSPAVDSWFRQFLFSLISSVCFYLGPRVSGSDTIFSSYPGTLHSVG